MRWALASLALLALACGANEAEGGPRPAETAEVPESREAPDLDPESEPEPEPPPPPAPVEIEAGRRCGPIRVGMTQEELRALGLDEASIDPRSSRFGPYRVHLRDGRVHTVEAEIGAIGPIRIGDVALEAGTHIHVIRDAIGDCVWTEGGGERYECAGGGLTVRTTHTMDPRRYTLGVVTR